MKAWLKFFRVVNLPTVPGDVLVGAAACSLGGNVVFDFPDGVFPSLLPACLASVFLYMFGLADNDIVGAWKDGSERPIPAGEVSLAAARVARGFCLFAALVVGALANLPAYWWVAAFLLSVSVVVYNRTKGCLMMGLCRGLNVICGGVALIVGSWRGVPAEGRIALLCAASVWSLYIMIVTKYSEGESVDPEKRRRVGFLIGAIVYLQMGTLLAVYLSAPSPLTRNLLLADAGLLVVLRLMKRFLPGVSAS